MSVNDNLDAAKKKLEQLRKEYEKLTNNKAPLFNVDNIDQANIAIDNMNKSIRTAKKEAQEFEEGWGGIAGAIGAAVAEIKRSESATNRTAKAMIGIRNIAEELKQDQQGLRDLNLKDLQSKKDKLAVLTEEAKAQAKLSTEEYNQVAFGKNNTKLAGAALTARLKKLGISKQEFRMMESIAAASSEDLKNLDEANEKIKERIKEEQEVLKKTSLIGAGLESMQGFLSKAGAGALGQALGLDNANKKMRELAKEGASTTQILKGGFSEIGKSIMTGLANPLTAALGIFTFLYKKATEVDKYIGNMSKTLNITNSEAQGLAEEFNHFKAMALETGVTTQGMAEALTAVNGELGLAGRISNENLATMEKLNRFAGLNYQQQAQTLKTAMATGEEYEDYIKNVQGTIKLKKFEQGLALNEKKIMLDINKAADSIKLSIAGGGDGLANAAVAAAKLGVSLNKVDQIAGSLLNFEESIKNELDAELLTGKELNLEKARELALNNDLEGVAKEIANQVGTAAEFNNMNRIAQESMAKAVGMTRDELAGALIEQEAIAHVGGLVNDQQKEAYEAYKKQYGAEAAAQKLKEDGLDSLMKQMTLEEQQKAQQDEFNETLQGLALSLMPFFNLLMEIANVVLPLITLAFHPIIEGISVLSKGIKFVADSLKKYPALLIPIVGLFGSMLMNSLGSAIAWIYQTFAQIPLGLGIPLAVTAAAGLASMATKYFTGDDIMSPGEGSSGYGKRTLFGPEGAIQLNNKDTVIAGTNLFGDDTVSEPGKATEMKGEGELKIGGGGGKIDMSSVVNAINALGARVDALASRPISVNVDGNKIIEATTGDRPIESGEAASKKSFKIQ